eukprot:snap_masked-scaffold_16-processed-gene-1.36-mRNA-1 protein AED:1.00 eAED:1.00 QI:0/0/0/0/1/1/7/0/186
MNSCVIQGTDTGVCMDMSAELKIRMPFCGEIIEYPVCLPALKGLDTDIKRFQEFTIETKDLWVQGWIKFFQQYFLEWDRRKRVETNLTLDGEGIDEYGNKGSVTKRFYNGDNAADNEDPWLKQNDCSNAYKNYFCYSNFPRCDKTKMSLPLCSSVCENYFKSCGYQQDMFRCGPSWFLNGSRLKNH